MFDPSPELDLLLDHGLTDADIVVDFGTGTGVFPLTVADYCDRVIAIDISEPMLDVFREKVEAEGIQNIEIVHGGLVNYEHEGDPPRWPLLIPPHENGLAPQQGS